MELTTIAKPYAKALSAIALECNSYNSWKSTLDLLSVITTDNNTQEFLNSPSINNSKKISFIVKTLETIAGKELDKLEVNYISLLVTNDRINVSGNIAELFVNYSNSDTSKVIDVSSAYDISKQEKEQLISDLSKKLGSDLSLNINIDTGLTSGIIIKDGDKVIDLSINARVNKLNACLSIN